MDISQQINQLLEKYDCTAKDLASAAGMSVSVISRYRNGTRRPSQEQIRRLASGFARIAQQRGKEIETERLFSVPEEEVYDSTMLVRKFNLLAAVLGINMNDFARFCSYDPSLISRVRSYKRALKDPRRFAENTGRFLCQKYRSDYHRKTIASLIGVPEMPQSSEDYLHAVMDWLFSEELYTKESLFPFIENQKNVDVESYLTNKGYTFPEKTDPPFHGESRLYLGTRELKQAELDFLRFALHSDTRTLYLFSNMPFNAIVADDSFSDDWLYLMSCIVNKGVSVHIINFIDRQYDELIIALKRLLPLYISGKIHAYYIPAQKNPLFCHHCCCIEDRVIYGETVNGFPEKVRCVITREPSEVAFRKSQMEQLMKKARPLLNIYRKENESVLRHFFNADAFNSGERIGIYSNLHLGLISEAAIRKMARRQHFTESELDKLLALHREYRKSLTAVLQNGNKLKEVYYLASKQEFETDPPQALIINGFFDKTLYFEYNEYMEQVEEIAAFARQHKNYSIDFKPTLSLKNINLIINKGHWVSITRAQAPNLHIIIRQQYVREAIENLASILSSPD